MNENDSKLGSVKSSKSIDSGYNTKDFQDYLLGVLNDGGEDISPVEQDTLKKQAFNLEKALLDFHVEGEVVKVEPGPIITRYQFSPAPGVTVKEIERLEDDLCMCLKVPSVRIVKGQPEPGLFGIEIANEHREPIGLKNLLESEAFNKFRGQLPLAMGRDILGKEVVADLAKMPHLLIAGATGTGKSVMVHAMILSLLYSKSPDELRMIMIDPKMLELSVYDDIPHLLLPAQVNPKKAVLALQWAVREMENRYQLMAELGVRNIDGYNRKVARKGGTDHHLPRIVLFVDELSDLMMVAGPEVEEAIARLAQMARAAGIHLVLTTQRPSPEVITGLIKANFPTRIAFKVFSRADSRTVLDQRGAETLLGMGDMLFLPPGTAALQRVHGAFVADDDIQNIADYLGFPEHSFSGRLSSRLKLFDKRPVTDSMAH